MSAMSNENQRRQAVLQAYVKAHGILGGMGPTSQERLSASCRLVQLEEGGAVFHQGQDGRAFYALCSGSVKVYRSGPDGREAVVKIMGPGEIFGEVVMFRPMPYPASAVCLGPTVLVEIEKTGLLALLADEAFRLDFFEVLVRKLEYLTNRVFMLSALDVEERFFQYIISNYGQREHYELDISKKDLASAIGTVPETLSRLLNRLKGRGSVDWEGKNLRIDPAALRYYASETGAPAGAGA